MPAFLRAIADGRPCRRNPGVECSDSPPYPANLTSAEIVSMVLAESAYTHANVSRHFANLGVTACPRWTGMREPERFEGTFNKTLSNDILIVRHFTSLALVSSGGLIAIPPLELQIGNTADPITSLTHARLAHKIQPQSRLVHQVRACTARPAEASN